MTDLDVIASGTSPSIGELWHRLSSVA